MNRLFTWTHEAALFKNGKYLVFSNGDLFAEITDGTFRTPVIINGLKFIGTEPEKAGPYFDVLTPARTIAVLKTSGQDIVTGSLRLISRIKQAIK